MTIVLKVCRRLAITSSEALELPAKSPLTKEMHFLQGIPPSTHLTLILIGQKQE